MSRLDDLKSSLSETWEKIKESESYQQVKAKYDELDAETKLYIHLGTAAGVVLVILMTVFSGISKTKSLKTEMDEREQLIGYLQQSADTIKRLKAQQEGSQVAIDTTSPLNTFVENVKTTSGLDKLEVEVGPERPGTETTKDVREALVDIRVKQINLRQLTKFLFDLTDKGAPRNLNIRDLNIDTKNDPSGYLDAYITIATYTGK